MSLFISAFPHIMFPLGGESTKKKKTGGDEEVTGEDTGEALDPRSIAAKYKENLVSDNVRVFRRFLHVFFFFNVVHFVVILHTE